MYGTRGSLPGCSRLYSSACTASRRSSVQEVTDQTSAATPQSWASSCWALSAHCMPVPEARMLALTAALGAGAGE